VKKRKILYNIILVQEAIHSSNIRGGKGMIIKIDMANFFDKAKHSFLNAILDKFGFKYDFITYIGPCINNP